MSHRTCGTTTKPKREQGLTVRQSVSSHVRTFALYPMHGVNAMDPPGSRMQQIHKYRPLDYRPYGCGMLSLSHSTRQLHRGWQPHPLARLALTSHQLPFPSGAFWTRAVETVHELHQQDGPLAREVFRLRVRWAYCSCDLFHHQLVVPHRLLPPQVLDLDAALGLMCSNSFDFAQVGNMPEHPSILSSHGCRHAVPLLRCWWPRPSVAPAKT